MIIDMHAHLGESRDGGKSTVEQILENMKICGISKTVLFAMDEEGCGLTFSKENDKILEAYKRYPENIIPFVRVAPTREKNAISELQRCLKKGAKGLKLKPLDGFSVGQAESLLEVIKTRENFPLMIHTAHQPSCRPDLWEPFFDRYPQLIFILAHGGKDEYRFCAQILKKYPNVFADTTTLSLFRTKYLYEHAGANKLVFASDFPYSHPILELKKYQLVIKDYNDYLAVTEKNAERIFDFTKA